MLSIDVLLNIICTEALESHIEEYPIFTEGDPGESSIAKEFADKIGRMGYKTIRPHSRVVGHIHWEE